MSTLNDVNYKTIQDKVDSLSKLRSLMVKNMYNFTDGCTPVNETLPRNLVALIEKTIHDKSEKFESFNPRVFYFLVIVMIMINSRKHQR